MKTFVIAAFHVFKKLSRDMDNIKKESEIQMKLLEMNTVMFDMKNTLDGINGSLDFVEERIGEPQDIAIETIQKETRRKNNLKKKMKREPVICRTNSSSLVNM